MATLKGFLVPGEGTALTPEVAASPGTLAISPAGEENSVCYLLELLESSLLGWWADLPALLGKG